jgi:hypothetical protein
MGSPGTDRDQGCSGLIGPLDQRLYFSGALEFDHASGSDLRSEAEVPGILLQNAFIVLDVLDAHDFFEFF